MRQLSSSWTWFHRALTPLFVLVCLGLFVREICLTAQTCSLAGELGLDALLGLFVAVTLTALYRSHWTLREVFAEENGLKIDGGFSSSHFVRYRDIERVARRGQWVRIKARSATGADDQSFVFIPQDSSAVVLIRERVALARAQPDVIEPDHPPLR